MPINRSAQNARPQRQVEPKLIDQICRIRRCEEPARYNYVIQGHPNGDVACSYCHEHYPRHGHWDESPTPYTITITGPIRAEEQS